MSRRNRLIGSFLSLVLLTTLFALPASANHPVLVEGNCFGEGSGETATGLKSDMVMPGTCGDYDSDGRIGQAEDGDGDNNFGSISAALTAVGQNGRVSIVTSGTFPEVVRLSPQEQASVTLEAAPGVEANIDAVVQGQAGGEERIKKPGIIIDGCRECRVIVRNVTTRNWTAGVLVRPGSQVLLEDVRAENNLNYGIRVRGRSRVVIDESTVTASGYRKGAAGPGETDDGIGIKYTKRARGVISDTTVSGSAGAGIDVWRRKVDRRDLVTFNNRPNRRLR